jgi:hypothetical protein
MPRVKCRLPIADCRLPPARQEIREIRFNRAVDHVDEVSAMTKDAVRLMHEQERKETDDRCAPRFRDKSAEDKLRSGD